MSKVWRGYILIMLGSFSSSSFGSFNPVEELRTHDFFSQCIKKFDQFYQENSSNVLFENKKDGSLVSSLEQAIERNFGEWLKNKTPWASFQGEEGYTYQASHLEKENYKWYIDPIDGTISFKNNLDTYSFTLTLVKNREPLAALVYLPVLKKYISSFRGFGTFFTDLKNFVSYQLKINNQEDLNQYSIIARSDDYAFKYLKREKLLKICENIPAVVRTYTDAFAYVQIVCGKYLAKIDAAAALWDLYPVYLIIREAGGEFILYIPENITSDLFCSCLSGSKKAVDTINDIIFPTMQGLVFRNKIPSKHEVSCND